MGKLSCLICLNKGILGLDQTIKWTEQMRMDEMSEQDGSRRTDHCCCMSCAMEK